MLPVILRYTYLFALVIAAAGGFYHWKRLTDALKLVTILLTVSITTELFSIVFNGLLDCNIQVHHHLCSIAEYTLTTCCYLSLLKMLNRPNAIVVFLSATAIVLLNAFLLQPANNKDSYVIALGGVIFTIIAAHAIFKLMLSEETGVLKDPVFWFWLTQMIGGFTTFLFWGLYQIAHGKQYEDLYDKMDLGNIIVAIALCFTMAYAMIMLPRKTVSQS